MRNFKELTIWQKSHQLSLEIYKATRFFPPEEMYGLISQIRRSSSSIARNIAEGCGRNSNSELNRFLTIASGSCSELEYQMILSRDLHYLTPAKCEELALLAVDIRRMIYTFKRNMK